VAFLSSKQLAYFCYCSAAAPQDNCGTVGRDEGGILYMLVHTLVLVQYSTKECLEEHRRCPESRGIAAPDRRGDM
jgi:hypothetical protein